MLTQPRRAAWIALVVVLIGAAGVRARLLETPFERDEGEYAYAAQLLLEGVPPYAQAYTMKLPGIYLAYAVVLALFGQTHGAVHLGLLIVNSITIVSLFLLAREWTGSLGAVVSAAVFALLSVGQPVQGIFANAEHFVLPFAILGLWVTARGATGSRWAWLFLGGMLLGVGVTMKQHGAALAVFGVGLAWALGPETPRNLRVRGIALYGLGVVLPYAITCLVLALAGTFDAFWFWTVQYASDYVTQNPLSTGISEFRNTTGPLLRQSPLIWILVLGGMVSVVLEPTLRRNAWRVLTFALLSFLATCPGLHFRPHYFILLLPAAGLLVGALVSGVAEFAARRRAPVIGLLGIALSLVAFGDALSRQRDFLFRMTPTEASRSSYGVNPFPESLEIARFIREHTRPDDRIAILGSEPQILFYAQRRSATGYIYTYGLMEPHDFASRMQREMIAEIESAKPRLVVVVNVSQSWLKRSDSLNDLFVWFEGYRNRNYDLVGLVEIWGTEPTVYHWGDETPWPSRARDWVAVLQRKS